MNPPALINEEALLHLTQLDRISFRYWKQLGAMSIYLEPGRPPRSQCWENDEKALREKEALEELLLKDDSIDFVLDLCAKRG